MNKHQVVVAYDFSKHADVAMQQAIELAIRDPENVLHFVTVIDEHHDRKLAAKLTEDIMARIRMVYDAHHPGAPIELFAHVRVGAAVPEILKFAEEVGADLIICGSQGRGALGRLIIGSVSEGVLHGARCPVTIVRAKGYPYVSPEAAARSFEHHERAANPPPAQGVADAAKERSRHLVMRT